MNRIELSQWDGRTQYVARPADFVEGVFRLHQIEARDLLRLGSRLNEWEASILQALYYQGAEPSEAQAYWLSRIAEVHALEVAA